MEKWRQRLHIEPPEGWLNDPNGLCFFEGKYHVFFQYSPRSPEGKTLRCWGHYAGKSLFDMSYEGIALSPDIPEDKDGVYSGSALVSGGRLNIFYTGNVKEEGDFDYITKGRGANVIRVVSGDGIAMGEKQVMLRNSDYPDFCSCHVRDPKVWKEAGGYKMVLGARTLDGKGCVLIYRSDSLESWEYVTAVSKADMGYMWECPDYFSVGGKGFLSVSPQGLEHYPDRYQNLFQSGYFPLEGSLEEGRLGEFYEWDMGFDFYAPQTFEAPDGRRVLIGWMGMGDDSYKNLTVALGWQHCLTIPREITADEKGLLLQNPIAEINSLFGEKRRIKTGEYEGISLPFDLSADTDGEFSVSLDGRLFMIYDPAKKQFSLEFTDRDYGGGRTVRRLKTDRCSHIRIIADMSGLEIFINGGENVMSTRFYPEGETVKLRAAGKLSAEVSLYKGGGKNE